MLFLFVKQNLSMQRRLAENMAVARAREKAVSLSHRPGVDIIYVDSFIIDRYALYLLDKLSEKS